MLEAINENSLLSRGIKVITAISQKPEGARFSDIASAIGSPSSRTTSKILKELMFEDVIKKNDNGTYSISRKVLFWASSMPDQKSARDLVEPFINKISRQFGVSVNLLKFHDGHMSCIESLTAPYSPALLEKGLTRECMFTLQGSLFFMDKERRENVSEHMKSIRTKDPSLGIKQTSKDQVKEILKVFESEQIYDDHGYIFSGMRRLAVSLISDSAPQFSLGVGFMSARAEDAPELIGELKKELLNAKKELEAQFKFYKIKD